MSILATLPIRNLLGVRIHAATMNSALAVCEDAIRQHIPLQISVVNAAKLVNMRFNPELRSAIANGSLVLADGMSVVWSSRLLGQPLPERVAGIDLFEQLLRFSHAKGYRVYFVGATQEVLGRVMKRIECEFPDIVVAGAHHGYYTDSEAKQLFCDIRDARPDILFVGMGSPRKEIFMNVLGRAALVTHGVGGSFDVFARAVRRAPPIWQRIGLEWLYRLLQEPRKMWRRYLVTNPIFIMLVLRQFLLTRIIRFGNNNCYTRKNSEP